MKSLRIQHSTAARHSYQNGSDVSRLVATEHSRNKYSLRESITLQICQNICSTILIKSTALNCTYCNQSKNNYTEEVDLCSKNRLKNNMKIALFKFIL